MVERIKLEYLVICKGEGLVIGMRGKFFRNDTTLTHAPSPRGHHT
jgi:hypothetical protein